jgi:hypothetical protein
MPKHDMKAKPSVMAVILESLYGLYEKPAFISSWEKKV